MNAQLLKNSILQEAIEGRLVPQDPNDEPASVLLSRIRKEKERMVKDGKLKKKDLEVKPISEDEIPFEIPESWAWVRLGAMISLLSGRDLAPSEYNDSNNGIPYMTGASNFDSGTLITNRWTNHPVTISHKGDLLITCKGTIGEMAFNNIGDLHIARQIMAINTLFLDLNYVRFFLVRTVSKLEKKAKSIIPGISREDILNASFPLPPLSEQQRIVAKIEELLPKVEEYGKAQDALNKLNAELPERLRKSILQEAIEGRLVPQDPNDEPAYVLLDKIRKEKAHLLKEGKLKKENLIETPIEEEGYPYAIPKSWQWVRLEDITTYISRGKSPIYSEIKKYPIVAQKCNQWSGFSIDKAKFADPSTIDKYAEERILLDGDLLWNSTGLGTLGRMAIYNSKANPYGWAAADSHVTVIRTRPDFCSFKYLFYYFASYEVQSVIEDKSDGSTKQKELYQDTVKKYEVPLPPLAEQHRIVEKLEQLLGEIDRLNNN